MNCNTFGVPFDPFSSIIKSEWKQNVEYFCLWPYTYKTDLPNSLRCVLCLDLTGKNEDANIKNQDDNHIVNIKPVKQYHLIIVVDIGI